MTTSSTSLLGLALPVTGELNGTWGDVVNNSLTSLLDTAIAGTTTLSTDADVTLTTTALLSNQARQAVILCSGSRTAIRTITAPAQSKTYVVINNTTGGFAVKIVGAGPTTGVTVPNGKAYMVAWNGSDFVVTNTTINLTTDVTGVLPVANGGTNLSSFTANQVFYAASTSAIGQSSNLTFNGFDLTVYGITVGRGNGGSPSNTVLGSGALNGSPSTGLYNTAIGVSALAALSYGDYNTAIGAQTLSANTSGISNVAVGAQALLNNQGSYNTAIGTSALSVATGVDNNTAIGFGALIYNLSASSNSAVGYNAMYYMRGGTNTALGSLSMRGSTTPTNNTGTENIAIGHQSLFGVTTGTYNTVLGTYAGYTLTGGNANTLVGRYAGYYLGTSNNTFVGSGAGYLISTVGEKNTILGCYNGNQGSLDIRNSSNYIVLSDGDGNPRAYWNGANATFNGALTLANTLRTPSGSVAGSGTLTPAADSYNQYNVQVSGGSATFAAPSGTPADSQKLLIRITDDGTARALTWNAIYRVIGTTLPTTTVANKTIYVGCVYNSSATKWDVVAVTTQA